MLKKLLTSFLGVFRDDSATVLFPGFGVQPENYVVKFPTQHVIRLNIWSEEDYNNYESVKQKAHWCFKWMEPKKQNFATRLVAFAAVEMLFFSSSFAAIKYGFLG